MTYKNIKRKGIILAGGAGTRLYPSTKIISKQLLPIYDKPMIYYPLSTLMLANIQEILIITTPEDKDNFIKLLGDGSQFGLKLEFKIQQKPAGLAQALIIAESFLQGLPSVLILGDNLFYGSELNNKLLQANENEAGATIFGYHVNDPSRYGIVEFNKENKVIGVEEKPSQPKSNYAITGIYFYDKHAPSIAKRLKPSARGELEITDLNKIYLKENNLNVTILGRGFAWLDTGTHESLLEANLFIHTIEKRQNLKIACLEEIAFKKGWINKNKLEEIILSMAKNSYREYLLNLL